MKVLRNICFLAVLLCMMVGCNDDVSFSTSPSLTLSFSSDTISTDTVFSNTSSTTRSLWVYNRSGKSLRLSTVALEGAGRSPFRVNVDGQYLGASMNYQLTDVELRKGDSLRVYVEFTGPLTEKDVPVVMDDKLNFTLESGVRQQVALRGWSWEANKLTDLHVKADTTIATRNGRPIVVYGGINVDSAATLKIAAGTTLYFHADAGIDVGGTLLCEGTADAPIVLRGDRIDRMFDYLPYDRTPGQWKGINLRPSSMDNVLNFTNLHSAFHGIVADSAYTYDRTKLRLYSSTIHNCQGYGLFARRCAIELVNTTISNTLNDCLMATRCRASINGTTLAQFYPFDAARGYALNVFSPADEDNAFAMCNSLITGYADDVVNFLSSAKDTIGNVHFDYVMMRMPRVTTADSVRFTHVFYEDVKDTTSMGSKHFDVFDTDNLIYNFSLGAKSAAIDKADPQTAPLQDATGQRRDERPDLGAWEFKRK